MSIVTPALVTELDKDNSPITASTLKQLLSKGFRATVSGDIFLTATGDEDPNTGANDAPVWTIGPVTTRSENFGSSATFDFKYTFAAYSEFDIEYYDNDTNFSNPQILGKAANGRYGAPRYPTSTAWLLSINGTGWHEGSKQWFGGGSLVFRTNGAWSASNIGSILDIYLSAPNLGVVNPTKILTSTTSLFNFLIPMGTIASASGASGFNIPHGAAPSAPVNGDIWTTSAGMFVRINGVTKSVNLT